MNRSTDVTLKHAAINWNYFILHFHFQTHKVFQEPIIFTFNVAIITIITIYATCLTYKEYKFYSLFQYLRYF